MDSKLFLEKTIDMPTQTEITDIKYPCTGFCYYCIENKNKILSYILLKKYDQYRELIIDLVKQAGERKKNNQLINNEGEFMNEDTIKKDFEKIYNNTEYREIIITEYNDIDQIEDEIYSIILGMTIFSYIIVTRSNETIIIFRINLNKYLIIDSHQPYHGLTNCNSVIKYITRDMTLKGTIDIGIEKRNGLLS